MRHARAMWLAGGAAVLATGFVAIRLFPRAARELTHDAAQASDAADSRRCAQCHAAIAATFRKTGMGRSFYRLTAQTAAEDFRGAKPFYHAASASYFEVRESAGKYYQRRWQIGFDGKETNVEEKQIDFVLGSGNHAKTYLHLTGRNTLQQLPLGWYAENGGYWAMNPGYDTADHRGSTRPIHYECMFCHNAYPKIPAGHEEAGAEPQYVEPLPEGIDCQRCHGPGRRHIEAAERAGAKPEEIRAAIVNSSRLSGEREMEVCMVCHLETTSRLLPHAIQRLDRGPFSWKPGEALGDFRLAFDRSGGNNPDFEIAHGAYRLRQSRCFLESAGKLRCTTCHDPHDIPRGEKAVAHYDQACRGCHAGVIKPESVHAGAANCAGCHMAKRRTDDAVHVVMTDHLIARRKPSGDLLAMKSEKHDDAYRGVVAPYYPEKPSGAEAELYVAMAQVIDRSNAEAGLPRLSGLIEKQHPRQAGFYAAAGEGYRSAGDVSKATALFEEALAIAPTSEIVLLQEGNALLEAREWSKAEAALRKATGLRPDDAAAWGLLGWSLWQQDKRAEAKADLEKALQLDPDAAELHNYLASVLTGMGDAAGAEQEFRAAIRINPGVAEWHENLGKLLAGRGGLAESVYEFEQCIRLKPADAPVRVTYARVLASANRLTEAEKQVRNAITVDPALVEAHELLGYLLSAEDNFVGAIPELRLTLRMKPGIGRAHYELGIALGRTGHTAEADAELRLAAQSNDPQAQAAAAEVLRRAGR